VVFAHAALSINERARPFLSDVFKVFDEYGRTSFVEINYQSIGRRGIKQVTEGTVDSALLMPDE